MNIQQLYDDYSVHYLTEGHYHCRNGWIQVHCPLCTGEQNYHLGYNLKGDFYTCWRCGWHNTTKVISALLQINEHEARKVIKQYGSLTPKRNIIEPVITIRAKAYKFPSGTLPMQKQHKKYLENRGFDPDKLESEWGLLGTGPISILKDDDYKLNYKNRIILPFIWNNKQVSFDSRDITEKHFAKYMACPKDRELIPHKEILYGKQSKWIDKTMVVEGPTDVWRFGENSVATSGIKFTPEQVKQIAKFFRRAAICFDGGEQQSIKQANKLIAELKFRGVDAFRVDIKGDPGSMKQEDANYLVKTLIK